jgi:metal-dependent hydrolase (beta-lactamase superfamily II)
MELKKDFQIISAIPIVAIIYTHNHGDHMFGVQVFAEDNLDNIKSDAHSKTFEILNETMSFMQPITFQREARQFGTYLRPPPSKTDLSSGTCYKGEIFSVCWY